MISSNLTRRLGFKAEKRQHITLIRSPLSLTASILQTCAWEICYGTAPKGSKQAYFSSNDVEGKLTLGMVNVPSLISSLKGPNSENRKQH